MVDRIERARVEPIRERVVDHEGRDFEEMAVVRIFNAVTLQCAEIVRIAELDPQLLEDGPVALLALFADLAREMMPEVVGDAIVVKQRIVHVEEKHDRTAAWIP